MDGDWTEADLPFRVRFADLADVARENETASFEAWQDAKVIDQQKELWAAAERRRFFGERMFSAHDRCIRKPSERNVQRYLDLERDFQAAANAEAEAIEKLEAARAKWTFERFQAERQAAKHV